MITVSAMIESVSTRRDRTYKIILGTQELPPNEAAEVLALHQNICYVALKPEPFTTTDIDNLKELKTDFAGIKSDSQRLRAVLYVLHEQENGGFADFTSFYTHHLNKIIDHYKSKLDQTTER